MRSASSAKRSGLLSCKLALHSPYRVTFQTQLVCFLSIFHLSTPSKCDHPQKRTRSFLPKLRRQAADRGATGTRSIDPAPNHLWAFPKETAPPFGEDARAQLLSADNDRTPPQILQSLS